MYLTYLTQILVANYNVLIHFRSAGRWMFVIFGESQAGYFPLFLFFCSAKITILANFIFSTQS